MKFSKQTTDTEEAQVQRKLVNVDRQDFSLYCDERIPAPFVARPIVVAVRGRGLVVTLEYPGVRVCLTDGGRPTRFGSIHDVMSELDGVPNIDVTRLVIDTRHYWPTH